MKKLRYLFAFLTAIDSGTLLFFGYRYAWFGIETIPGARVGAIFGMFIVAGCAWMLNEIVIETYKN